MSQPDRATKHIPKPQASIGAQKNGKLKVIDGTTGRESWRQGKTGFIKDIDGDPISKAPAGSGAKNRPQHHARESVKHGGEFAGRMKKKAKSCSFPAEVSLTTQSQTAW